MSEMKTIMFPGDTEPREIVDASARQRLETLEQAKETGEFNGADGRDGADGSDGKDGNGIKSIVRTSGDGSPGTTDTYTITYTDDSTSTYTVYNGADGDDGATPQFSIGTVETLEAGSAATASIGGTAEKPVLNLGIPRGHAGEGGDSTQNVTIDATLTVEGAAADAKAVGDALAKINTGSGTPGADGVGITNITITEV